MKNTTVKINSPKTLTTMKNAWLLIAVLIIAALFSSCQKDDDLFNDIPNQTEETQSTTDETTEMVKTTEKDDEIDFTTIKITDDEAISLEETDNDEVAMRSGRELVFSQTYTVSASNRQLIRHYKADMDPDCKYIAIVTRYAGDPDLYIVGSNGQQVRTIRRADIFNNGVREESYAYRADLRSYEDRLYYWITADQGQTTRFKIEIFKDCDPISGGGNDDNCSDILTGCEMVSCTPQTPHSNGDGGYSCGLTTIYTGDYAIQRWEVTGANGEDVSHLVQMNRDLSSTPTITCRAPGTYIICCYYICDGVVYKCCQIVTCPQPPINDCCDDALDQSWLQNVINNLCSDFCTGEKIYCATYNGRPAIHVTPWTDCTDGIGTVYDCFGNVLDQYGSFFGDLSGTLQDKQLLWESAECYPEPPCTTIKSEDFEQYSVGAGIANSSFQWDVFSSQYIDAPVGSHHTWGANKYLDIQRDNLEDVVYKLGNRGNGKYELTFDIRVNGAAYFNIQGDQNQRQSGGVFQTYFQSNGEFYVKTNGGGQSNLFSYTKNNWVKVTINADFNNRDFSVQIGNRTINIVSAQNFFRLGGINFYAINGADYQVDNIELKRCN